MVLWEHPFERYIALTSLVTIAISLALLAGKRLKEPPVMILQTPPIKGSSPEPQITVHIKGAVANPGLFSLPYGSRVADAVKRARPFKRADLNGLNLAQFLEDGQEIVVPERTEVSQVPSRPLVNRTGGSLTFWGVPPVRKVHLNSATEKDLERLPGIGPALARRILELRRQRGGFKSVDELLQVPGIGPKKMEKIRAYIGL